MTIDFKSFKGDNSTNKDTKEALLFPSDLETKAYYPECIKFGIYERAGASLEKFGNDIKVSKDNLIKGIGEEKALKERLEKKEAEGILTDGERAELDGIGERLLNKAKEAIASPFIKTRASTLKQIQQPGARLIQSIYLQMPESLVYSEQVDWQGTDLGLVGAFKEGQLGAGVTAGALANAGKILGGAAGALTSLLPSVGTTAGVVLGTLLGGETGISGGIESTFNVKANPYKEQTFQGVPFRPFEFSFVFRPRNETEVIAMDQIITAFRAYSKPSFKNHGQSGVFAYPHEFLIEFLTLENGSYVRNKHIPQIKFCICKSVNTNWTTQGWKSFEGGAPVDTSLTLSFEETEIITQRDVVKGETTGVGDFASFGGDF